MKRFLILVLITFSFIISGCGDITAPPDATIEIKPDRVTQKGLAGPICQPFTIVVKNKDGIGIRDVIVYISGSLAAPRDPARYYFYKNTNCEEPYVDSNFSITTEDYGVAYFAISIPAEVKGAPNTFTDTIEVRSGTLYTSASVEVTE